MAAVTWAMMLRLLEPDDPRVPMLEKSIRAARDALALQEEEKSEKCHTREIMKPQLLGFHHIAIIASNYARSKHFYMEILGAKQLNETYRAERDSYKLDLSFPDGSQIELFSFPNPPLEVQPSRGLRFAAFSI